MSDIIPVFLGADLNCYNFARAFHEAYGVESSVGVQALGAFSVAIFAFIAGLILFSVIKHTHGLRCDKRIEEEGLDIYEHGEACYN